MRPIFKQSKVIALLAMSTLFSMLLSFSTKTAGGEGFEIFLNNKLIVQQFGSQMKTASIIQLDAAAATGDLIVKYYHCGRAGKERNIVIKNDQNKVLKSWHYGDASAPNVAMLCKVKDITGLQKFSKGSKLKLYYSSTELPAGRMLAAIDVADSHTAKR